MHTGIDVHIEGDTLIMGVSDSTKQYWHMANGSFFIPLPQRLAYATYASLNLSLIHWLSECFKR